MDFNNNAQFNRALFVVSSKGEVPIQSFAKAMEYTTKHGITLDILCILPDFSPLRYSHSNSELDKLKVESTESIRNKLTNVMAHSFPKFEGALHIRFGKEFIEVIRLVVNDNYDFVIKQAENRSWSESVLGSSDLHLLRKCPSAIWLIDQQSPKQYGNVAMALDFSDNKVDQSLNLTLATQAMRFSQSFNSALHLITAYDSSIANFASQWADNAKTFEGDYLEKEAARRRVESDKLITLINNDIANEQTTVVTYQHSKQGHAHVVIPQQVSRLKVDLLVMGTVGHAGSMGVLVGNTAEAILLQLKCSLFSVKPEGFKCPITF